MLINVALASALYKDGQLYRAPSLLKRGGGVVKCGLSSLEKSQSRTIKRRDSTLTVSEKQRKGGEFEEYDKKGAF